MAVENTQTKKTKTKITQISLKAAQNEINLGRSWKHLHLCVTHVKNMRCQIICRSGSIYLGVLSVEGDSDEKYPKFDIHGKYSCSFHVYR